MTWTQHAFGIESRVRFLLATVSILLVGAPISAAEPDGTALERDALAAEAKFDSTKALQLFLQLEQIDPHNARVLQKISRQYSDLTVETTDTAEKRSLCLKSLSYAQRAVEREPNDPVNVLSLAICYGKLATYSDTRTKLEFSKLVKQHAERALSLKPDYDYAHHVLGRWHYEVATLGVGARLVVRLIYGGLPPASTADAVRHLQKAVALSPQVISHRVELGFAYLAADQPAAARESFQQALTMPKFEKYDDEALQRAKAALRLLD